MDYKSLGERIRQHRRALNMTQEALGERANVCTSMIGHIERASRIPSLETIVRICEAMDVSLDCMIKPQKNNLSSKQPSEESINHAKKLLQMAMEMSSNP